jgi:hypothetical protein
VDGGGGAETGGAALDPCRPCGYQSVDLVAKLLDFGGRLNLLHHRNISTHRSLLVFYNLLICAILEKVCILLEDHVPAAEQAVN